MSVMNQSFLDNLGWDTFYEESFQPYDKEGFTVGRVGIKYKDQYRIYSEYGELLGEVTGKMYFKAAGPEDFPAVGDWVVIRPRLEEKRASIHAVLDRKSKFSRQAAGQKTEEQIVATNIDTVFLVNSLNKDFNPRRIERYLTLVWDHGANPVIVLSKADLCSDVEEKRLEIENIAYGVPIHVVSCLTGQGLEELKQYLKTGETVALLGSSGVGKSTLINYLLGDEKLKTADIRSGDDKGRHTTTHRELILLPDGGLVIDTPGMREIQLWDAGNGLSGTFADIEELATQCKFRDCSHRREPGCAIRDAIDNGTLSSDRLHSYFKLQNELRYLEIKQKEGARGVERAKWARMKG